MNIRHRITLWITGAGLLAGLLFSAVIYFEMIEQPYALLDRELNTLAQTLLTGLAPQGDGTAARPDTSIQDTLGRFYWFKVFDRQHLIFSSPMTTLVDLPMKNVGSSYTVTDVIKPLPDSTDYQQIHEMTFRVRVSALSFNGQRYLVQIARPMAKLQEEIVDLIIAIGVGLVLYTATLLLLGYFVAGRILQPIAEITTLSRKISEKTLEQRIPLGRNHDELYALSASLNQMFDRLQYSFARQKAFIADASHELKTPLAMQRLFFSEVLQRNDLPEDCKESLSRQLSVLLRMDRLVKNLLDISALELQEPGPSQAVNLSQICIEVTTEFAEMLQAAAIELTLKVEENIYVFGDEEQLKRLCINLIDNAFKYNCASGGRIRVLVHSEQQEVVLEFFNTGSGVPEKALTRVFTQFYRVDKSRSSESGGSGLGLTIVKRIVELHHGHIAMESEYGSWARVRIVLPCEGKKIV